MNLKRLRAKARTIWSLMFSRQFILLANMGEQNAYIDKEENVHFNGAFLIYGYSNTAFEIVSFEELKDHVSAQMPKRDIKDILEVIAKVQAQQSGNLFVQGNGEVVN